MACYIDGTKVTDPNQVIEINRQLQEAFPEAQHVTDAMVRSMSDVIVDRQQQEKEMKSEKIEDILGTGTQSTDVAYIPEWLQQKVGPKDDLNNITLDDYLEEETKKESTPEEKEHVQNLVHSLEIEDDEKYDPREAGRLTEEELKALLDGLEIKDDPVRERTPEEKQQIADLTASLEITDDEPVQAKPERTEEDIQQMIANLSLDEEEPTKTEVKDDDIGSIQARMDELMNNPAVMEYLELQEKMRTYYNQYKEAVEEEMAQEQQQEVLPDIVLQ